MIFANSNGLCRDGFRHEFAHRQCDDSKGVETIRHRRGNKFWVLVGARTTSTFRRARASSVPLLSLTQCDVEVRRVWALRKATCISQSSLRTLY